MEFTIKSGSPEKQRTGCVVVGVFENRKLSLSAELIDRASNGYISEILRRGDLEGKLGTTLLLHNVRGTLADRVLLVGLGKERDFRETEFRQAIRRAVKLLNETGSYEAVHLPDRGPGQAARHRLAGRARGRRGDGRRLPLRADEEQARRGPPAAAQAHAVGAAALRPRGGRGGVARGLAIADGMDLAKDLGNLPGNVCTPRYLAEQAQELGKEFPAIKVKVLERPDIEKLGMGSFLAVANGSDAAAAVHRDGVRAAARSRSRSCSSARASRSTPAASRSSPRPRWTR